MGQFRSFGQGFRSVFDRFQVSALWQSELSETFVSIRYLLKPAFSHFSRYCMLQKQAHTPAGYVKSVQASTQKPIQIPLSRDLDIIHALARPVIRKIHVLPVRPVTAETDRESISLRKRSASDADSKACIPVFSRT